MNMQFTPTQTQHIRYIAGGFTDKEIARKRNVAPGTAKKIAQTCLYKAHAKNRAELVAKAAGAGVLFLRLREG